MHYLVEHGIKNVWCTPTMDRQVILIPNRVSSDLGVKKILNVGWMRIKLPDNTNFYQCYLMGEIPRDRLGIDKSIFTDTWYRLSDLMSDFGVIYNVYVGSGREIPRENVKILILKNGGFVLCIKDTNIPFDFKHLAIHLRVYKNAYFETNRFDPDKIKIEVESIDSSELGPTELIEFINRHNKKNNRGYGLASASVNGIWNRNLIPGIVGIDSLIDSVFDGGVRDVFNFKVSDFKTFTSELDNLRKYLIHVPKEYGSGITYFDDLDFMVNDSDDASFSLGVRIPRNKSNVIRQVSHNDYAISVDSVDNIIRDYFNDTNSVYLNLVIRNSGYERPLWYVVDKVRALYKLNDSDIVNALLGIDSNVSFWRAEHLESGSYPNLMGKKDGEMTLQDVIDCYGYRGIVKVNSDTPIIVDDDSISAVKIPINYRSGAMVFEYSRWGTLANVNQVDEKIYYPITIENCAWIEFIKGLGGNAIYTGYNEQSFEISELFNYGFFKQKKDSEEEWVEVTDSGDYTIDGSTVTWNIPLDEWEVSAISDGSVYQESIELEKYMNHLVHTFKVDISGDSTDDPVLVDGGLNLNHYRIWLNGKALIRGVDFKIIKEKLYIVNKEYLDDDLKAQNLFIIANGIMLDTWLDDKGYVKEGKISFNKRYDYYDDRLLRVVVGGKVYPIEALLTAEDKDKPEFLPIRNGLPYVVENVTPALKEKEIDYKVLLEETLIREEILADYLTIKIPEEKDDDLDSIIEYYLLYSTLISTMIYEMNNGRIYIPDGRLTDEVIDIIVDPYKHLIEFDPATWELNWKYVSVHPHPFRYTLTVTAREFSVLERINEIYLDNVADLSPFLEIAGE